MVLRYSGLEMLRWPSSHRIHWNTSLKLMTQTSSGLRKLQLSPPQPLFQFRLSPGKMSPTRVQRCHREMTDGELQQILPGKEIRDSKDIVPSSPVKLRILGIQLTSGWSADTNLGSWRLAWTHRWGLWPQQGCPGPRCCGTGVTQELLKIHAWLLDVSTVTDGLAISAYLWDCCYPLSACLCSSIAASPLV